MEVNSSTLPHLFDAWIETEKQQRILCASRSDKQHGSSVKSADGLGESMGDLPRGLDDFRRRGQGSGVQDHTGKGN